jgi:hypothetical protein
MGNRRIVSGTILVGVCALIVVVGVANAGKGPDPRVEVPVTQPAEVSPTLGQMPVPPGWPCPGTEGVQNIHVRLSPPPDYLAQAKALGKSDAEARAYLADREAAEKALRDQMLATISTMPPPPCP